MIGWAVRWAAVLVYRLYVRTSDHRWSTSLAPGLHGPVVTPSPTCRSLPGSPVFSSCMISPTLGFSRTCLQGIFFLSKCFFNVISLCILWPKLIIFFLFLYRSRFFFIRCLDCFLHFQIFFDYAFYLFIYFFIALFGAFMNSVILLYFFFFFFIHINQCLLILHLIQSCSIIFIHKCLLLYYEKEIKFTCNVNANLYRFFGLFGNI